MNGVEKLKFKMGIKKKNHRKDSGVVSQSTTSSGAVTSSSASGGTQKMETVIVTTQQVPIVQEKLLQKSTSSNVVTKSSSSTKVSSSQEQNFYSTSSSMTSSSNVTKGGKTQQLQSQSDAFLRGERTIADIDAKNSKNGPIVIESVDLHNVKSDGGMKSNLNNLVSVEIESKDSRAASSSSELVTNTFSTKSINAGNRNDVITVESGKKTGETTTSTAMSEQNRDVQESSSFTQGSSATSSSTYQAFSSSGTGTDAKEIKSSTSTNAASSKTIKNGQVLDNKNVADTTTTFTSKVFDDKTKSWVVVEQASVNETDFLLPVTTTSTDGASTSNKMNTMTISSATGIDSTNRADSSSSNSKLMKSDMQMSSKSDVQMSSNSTKEVLEKNTSSKKESSRNEKLVSTSTSETVQVFDNKTKTWKNVDARSVEQQRRPSYMRYRSQNDDGTWHTTYKRKMYDEFTKKWRIVDEKVVSSEDQTRMTDIPEMIENATNITTTTYTTKIYDTKTGKWSVVDEKSYVDTESANVTQDIKREIERDQPDLANIITTTETTKVGN